MHYLLLLLFLLRLRHPRLLFVTHCLCDGDDQISGRTEDKVDYKWSILGRKIMVPKIWISSPVLTQQKRKVGEKSSTSKDCEFYLIYLCVLKGFSGRFFHLPTLPVIVILSVRLFTCQIDYY